IEGLPTTWPGSSPIRAVDSSKFRPRITRRIPEQVAPGSIDLQERPMPIFHFDIADRVRLEDPVGLDCKNELDARKTADLIARQIAIDLDADGEDRSVLVIDEAGSEIYKAAVNARCQAILAAMQKSSWQRR